ncbi:M43 family zinc metalloprotease [Flavobacteriales bacterium]|nr:M43 family zinc metalloprotease [Flavobacteriales bacterium]
MKINKLTFKTLLLILITSSTVFSQVSRNNFCSHNKEVFDRVKTDIAFKSLIDSIDAIQAQHEINYKNSSNSRAGTIYYIPVVYHIVHQGGVENISDAQVKSDLKDLNDIYRKLNTNVGSVNPAFSGISADIEIEFRLAQKKNDGSCFSGITRTFSPTTNTGGNSAADAVKAVHGDFPGNQYMNIFIVKSFGTSGAAGYTYRPGAPYFSNMRNGIHVLNTYIGNIGTSTQSGFNTTIAHEAGHWLNLPHLWGNSNTPGLATNCSGDDGVADTPNTIGWQTCNTAGVSCGSLDNVENIMEYSYCSKMFTNGQKTRMRAALTSSIGGRNNLISAANQTSTGIFSNIICKADFSAENSTACENTPVQFYDNSYHNPTSWSWTFDSGNPSSSSDQNPVVTYASAGKHNVSLVVTNANGSKSTIKNLYMTILPSWGAALPYSESFETSEAQFKSKWETVIDDDANISLSNFNSTGSKSALIRNFVMSENQVGEIISPSLNLTGNSSVNISFDYAYARQTTSSGESVQFLISNDCGNTWVISRGVNPSTGHINSEFSPTSSQWASQNIAISSSFFSPNFRFKFKLKNGNGNNFYLDNININNIVGIDELDVLTSVNIFPNPITNKATIELDVSKDSEVSIYLLNTIGEIVQQVLNKQSVSQGNSKFEINKNDLSKGIYFVNIEVNGIRKVNKLVIN